MLKIIKHN